MKLVIHCFLSTQTLKDAPVSINNCKHLFTINYLNPSSTLMCVPTHKVDALPPTLELLWPGDSVITQKLTFHKLLL